MDHITGDYRCQTLGHEVENLLSLAHGIIVGYCVRCSARFEAPWIRGGTAAALAQSMIDEALTLDCPSRSVLEDLAQVSTLLEDDARTLIHTIKSVNDAMEVISKKVA